MNSVKKYLLVVVFVLFATVGWAQEILVGMTDTASYMPDLRGQRVAVLANHTAVTDGTHLVDMLHQSGVNVVGIFAPEHGFRGTANAGEHVKNSVDKRTGIKILSLYDGITKRPSDEAMRSFDLLVVDMQDVGLRFYTYYISMLRMMDACADFGNRVIVLDRPNPNGHYIAGPKLESKHRSGVGIIPIPVVHGMTMGEIARMAIGEGWVDSCELKVVGVRNYDRNMIYNLPIAPSPNLPTQSSIYLYASMCMMEGTMMSMGRGTDTPFEVYGHPQYEEQNFSFTPEPNAGDKAPKYNGQVCYGVDLSSLSEREARGVGFTIKYVIDAYEKTGRDDKFFIPMFEKLIGVSDVRQKIKNGLSAEQIESEWSADVEDFRRQRRPYLIYAE